MKNMLFQVYADHRHHHHHHHHHHRHPNHVHLLSLLMILFCQFCQQSHNTPILPILHRLNNPITSLLSSPSLPLSPSSSSSSSSFYSSSFLLSPYFSYFSSFSQRPSSSSRPEAAAGALSSFSSSSLSASDLPAARFRSLVNNNQPDKGKTTNEQLRNDGRREDNEEENKKDDDKGRENGREESNQEERGERAKSPSLRSKRQVLLDYLVLIQDVMDLLADDENVTQQNQETVDSCVFVKSEEGTYSYVSPGGSTEVCGLYFIAQPNQLISIEFIDFHISCHGGGLLSVVDGWELSGEFFPSTRDHHLPRMDRFKEFCGQNAPNLKASFLMSQNVGMVEFRVPSRHDGFKVKVSFLPNDKPCNSVMGGFQGVVNLANLGREVNCTVSILFPVTFEIIYIRVGHGDINGNDDQNVSDKNLTAVSSNCTDRGSRDYLEIRGGDGLDPHHMAVVDNICGQSEVPLEKKIDVACGHTALRLVSSGHYVNHVKVAFDLFPDDNQCPFKPVNLT